MAVDVAALLGVGYGMSEVILALRRRARRTGAASADAGSLGLLWAVIVSCLVLAYASAAAWPSGQLGTPGVMLGLGCILFGLGLALRWYAIFYLGRYFTVDVAIAADHRVVDGGPYRYVRHPSYSGALLAFIGIGVSLNNALSLALLVPIGAAFLRRIQIEERALIRALGAAYLDYAARTKRLIPGIV